MAVSRRWAVLLFGLSVVLLAVFFGPFFLNEIIAPASRIAWLLLRIFVLSIDQYYYWGAIIVAVVILLFRLLSQDHTDPRSADIPETNETVKNLEYWRGQFTQTAHDERSEKTLRRELVHLLLSLYALRRHTAADFRLYEALRLREIPLPENIHAFLFPDEPKDSGRSIKKLLQSVWDIPRKWIRRWTGAELAEHHRRIDDVLGFIENSLENKNDQ